jgi:hypothetical protein
MLHCVTFSVFLFIEIQPGKELMLPFGVIVSGDFSHVAGKTNYVSGY